MPLVVFCFFAGASVSGFGASCLVELLVDLVETMLSIQLSCRVAQDGVKWCEVRVTSFLPLTWGSWPKFLSPESDLSVYCRWQDKSQIKVSTFEP